MATTQEYGLGEFAFPRGWFMVAGSDELGDRPLGVRYFGRDFALYRGKSGRVVMLDAYCAHMRTHLAVNTTSYIVREGTHIENDSIRCPYHGWRYRPDGVCDDIPYASRPIPKAACVKSWRVVEKFGCVFVWHDPENGEPDYQLPDVGEYDDPAWVRWRIDQLGILNLHPQELVDNIADYPHLRPIHGLRPISFHNEFRGHMARQCNSGYHTEMGSEAQLLTNDVFYFGPAVLLSRVSGLFEAIQILAHTPVEDGTMKVWHGLLVKSRSPVATAEDIAGAREFQDTGLVALSQDFDVWNNKAPCFNILQVADDGPFGKARTWYRQFYNPRAQAAPIRSRAEGVHGVPGVPLGSSGENWQSMPGEIAIG